MKKALVLAAALALAATPAAAQQSAAPAMSAQAQSSAVATATQAPTIFVGQDEIRQRVAAAEAEREGAQVGSSNWWYTVAAVALGVVIALLLID